MQYPEIVTQLRPVRDILDAMNEHLKIEDYYFGMDDGYLDMAFKGMQEGQNLPEAIKEHLDNMAYQLMAAADALLPEGVVIQVRDEKFILARGKRMTDEEMAEALGETGEPSADIVTVPFCYKILAKADLARDGKGNPVPFFGHATMHFYKSQPNDIELAKKRREEREWIANACLINVDDVIPISEEEYKANGGALEG